MTIPVTPLLIFDISEIIQFAQVILDFKILAQYVLYDKKTLRFLQHVLYSEKKQNSI